MKMDLNEFIKLIPARQRRTMNRGAMKTYRQLIEKIKRAKQGSYKKPIKTQARDMVVIPEMIGTMIHIHNGKTYAPLQVTIEMLGHYLGEFTLTRERVKHSAPGIGATKSSTAIASKAK
jgi:small subunit ribosomal protein S19